MALSVRSPTAHVDVCDKHVDIRPNTPSEKSDSHHSIVERYVHVVDMFPLSDSQLDIFIRKTKKRLYFFTPSWIVASCSKYE